MDTDKTEDQLREKVREALADYEQWLSVKAMHFRGEDEEIHAVVSHTQVQSAMRILWMDQR